MERASSSAANHVILTTLNHALFSEQRVLRVQLRRQAGEVYRCAVVLERSGGDAVVVPSNR